MLLLLTLPSVSSALLGLLDAPLSRLLRALHPAWTAQGAVAAVERLVAGPALLLCQHFGPDSAAPDRASVGESAAM